MSDETNMPGMLTVTEVQRYLRVGRSTAYNIVNAGHFPVRRVGGKGHTIRVPAKPFIEWTMTASIEQKSPDEAR